MYLIQSRNINTVWPEAKQLLNAHHVVRPSRVGEVMECPMPVTTLYERPCERVLFDPNRNCNHFFQLFESLHMLAGRRDVSWLEQFNSKIRDFIGKEELQHDAYGHRWRYAFDLDGGAEDDYADQLVKIIRMLKKNPDERRAVLTMWNPIWDLERPDQPSVPCNLAVTFKIRRGVLDMIVFCRSNDVVFGAYGANVVHMSLLQEYVASIIGIGVGYYWQVSDSWHAYTSRWKEFGGENETPDPDPYDNQSANPIFVEPYPLVSSPEEFDEEVKFWCDYPGKEEHYEYGNKFFPEVATPLYEAWKAYKLGNMDDACFHVANCAAKDWKLACFFWLQRIASKRDVKKRLSIA